MTKADRPYTYSFVAKGRRYWRFRSKETGRISLPGQPGEARFETRYGELLTLRERKLGRDRPNGTFAWLVHAYQRSAEYRALADSTQADYAITLALIEEELGQEPFRYTTRAMLKAVRDDYAATPRKAHKIKQMVSRLYSWADENSLVPEGFNPAAGLKRLKRKGGDKEIVPWSDPELEWAMAEAPEHVLTPLMIALYTGPRRKDVRTMTWQQWQDALVRVRTAKTHQLIDMPCHPVLRDYLERLKRTRAAAGAIPHATAPICLASDGTPWDSDNAMSGALRRFVEAHPRIPNDRSFHGVRYAAAGRMEEGGASVAAIESVLGHRTYRMAMKYASRRRRAAEGIAAMQGGE
jgi:integrase